jgi:type III secretion protein Q
MNPMPATLRHPALRLPTVSRDALGARNVLCRRRRPVEAAWLGQPWRFQLQPHSPAAPGAWYVTCDWGGACVHLGLAPAAAERVAAGLLDGQALAGWAPELVLACLECAVEELSLAIEAGTRKHLRLVGVGRERPAALAGLEAYGWVASCGPEQVCGELLLDAAASRYLAAVLREQPAEAADAPWDELHLRAGLVVGWVDLPAAALAGLAPHDVLVLDECLLSADSLLLQLAPGAGLRCELRGNELRVTQGVHDIMSEPEDAAQAAAAILEDVPVRLTFDVGEREIALGELRTLQPGYVFNLGRDPRGAVSIRANGRLVGEGELVDIEGRIGVSVLRLGPQAA